MTLLEIYLDRLHEIHATRRGTPELSYRAALENLLNAVGQRLDPAVQATAELADTGAGRPDFGLLEVKSSNLRGVVEVKGFAEDTPDTADGSQVTRYGQRYGYVLVTNYRDFLLIVKQDDGKARVEGRYQLAANAEAFWRSRPHTLAKLHAEGLTDFLIGVLTRSAPITRPQELADDLARHAREARRRLSRQDMSALEPLKQAMQQALGVHFTGDEGEAFFRNLWETTEKDESCSSWLHFGSSTELEVAVVHVDFVHSSMFEFLRPLARSVALWRQKSKSCQTPTSRTIHQEIQSIPRHPLPGNRSERKRCSRCGRLIRKRRLDQGRDSISAAMIQSRDRRWIGDTDYGR